MAAKRAYRIRRFFRLMPHLFVSEKPDVPTVAPLVVSPVVGFSIDGSPVTVDNVGVSFQ